MADSAAMATAAEGTPPPSGGGDAARRAELDWLRALVVLGLIPYHAALIYAVGPGDYVKSPQRSLVFDLAATVVSFFGMPLLFLAAGAATWYALGRRGAGRYMAERVARNHPAGESCFQRAEKGEGRHCPSPEVLRGSCGRG